MTRQKGAVAAALLSLLVATDANATESRPHAFETTRTFVLPAGRATRTFTLHEGSGVILLNRLTVPHGVRAIAVASIPHLAGARVSSRPSRNNPVLSCRRRGGFDVCTQGEEWCPMPEATWHVRLVKLSGPAGRVRFDYVVAPPPPKSARQ